MVDLPLTTALVTGEVGPCSAIACLPCPFIFGQGLGLCLASPFSTALVALALPRRLLLDLGDDLGDRLARLALGRTVGCLCGKCLPPETAWLPPKFPRRIAGQGCVCKLQS